MASCVRYRSAKVAGLILGCLGLILCVAPAFAVGGVAHYYIARAAAERLVLSGDTFRELREALKDPANLNAFCNGAIAPDLSCLVEAAHHGKTTRMPMTLMNAAEDAYEAANRLPLDDPKRRGKIAEAAKAMCFSFGWLSHLAADLAVHPKVNARVGDAYEFAGSKGKADHAIAEIQITHYLSKTIKKPDYKVNFDIPYWLVSHVTGLSEQKLQDSVKAMRLKLVGEVLASNQVDIPISKLKSEWHNEIQSCIADSVRFINDPEKLEDWDLDYGRITTVDFRRLRGECMQINDGKVPVQWGKEYLNWWNIVRSLPDAKRHEVLVELIKGRRVSVGYKEIVVRSLGPIVRTIWVNGTEIEFGKNHIIRVPKGTPVMIRVLADGSNRSACLKKEYQGNNVRILDQNPYILHYVSSDAGIPYEFKLEVTKESYTWKALGSSSSAHSSGIHPKVKNDVFDWNVPSFKKTSTMDSRIFVVHIECASEWYTLRKWGTVVGVAGEPSGQGRPSVLGQPSRPGKKVESTMKASASLGLRIEVEGD